VDKDFEKIKLLAETLSKCSKVTQYNTAESDEAWTISHNLIDLEESFKNITNELLPELLNVKLNDEKIEDILLDIGEEFRHILYHIKNSKYYEYLN
jgi:hypothetical protein